MPGASGGLAGILAAGLRILLDRRTWTIFSLEYRDVVAETPFIRPRSGCMLIAAGFGLIFLISMGLTAFGLVGRN